MPKLAYSVTERKEGREVEMMQEGSGRREGRKGRREEGEGRKGSKRGGDGEKEEVRNRGRKERRKGGRNEGEEERER